MCGIVAIVSQEKPVDRAALLAARSTLRHRGPDGEGAWFSTCGRVALGHSRLAVMDLESGGQPLSNEDSSVWLVSNGEFYGFESIKRDLESRGHRFRTRSDAEIALHLYEERGIDCLEELRGEFAFILWDQRERRLLAVRDRFGIKPLCYASVGGNFLIASEAKALFALGAPRAWDNLSFYHVARHQYLPSSRTMFEGISQLPPGHFLLASDRGLEIRRYWDLDYPREDSPAREQTPESLIEEFKARLDEAVKLRLRSDVPVAFSLSGGLDSSAVVALAGKYGAEPAQCFTLGFEEKDYDERSAAKRTAAYLGAHLQLVSVRQQEILEHISEAVYYSEGLGINGQLIAKFLLAREVRRAGFKVLLSGEGADELLAGYAHLKRDLYLAAAMPEIQKASFLQRLELENRISCGVMLPGEDSPCLDSLRARLGFVPSFLQAKAAFGLQLMQLLNPDYQSRFTDLDPFEELVKSFDDSQLENRHPLHQSSYLWTKLALGNYILRTLGDGVEMAHSVESRLPFLDHTLFEFCRTLPLEMKVRGTVEKHILREALRQDLPEAVYNKPKHPLLAPPLSRFASRALQSSIQERLQIYLKNSPLFDGAKVLAWFKEIVRADPFRQQRAEPVLMTILCACSLQEGFGLAEGRA